MLPNKDIKKKKIKFKKIFPDGTVLAVQWLGLWTSTTEGTGSVPVWGTKIPYVSVWPKKKKTHTHLLQNKR